MVIQMVLVYRLPHSATIQSYAGVKKKRVVTNLYIHDHYNVPWSQDRYFFALQLADTNS